MDVVFHSSHILNLLARKFFKFSLFLCYFIRGKFFHFHLHVLTNNFKFLKRLFGDENLKKNRFILCLVLISNLIIFFGELIWFVITIINQIIISYFKFPLFHEKIVVVVVIITFCKEISVSNNNVDNNNKKYRILFNNNNKWQVFSYFHIFKKKPKPKR